MNRMDKAQIAEDFSWAVSRLISKSIRIISETYKNIALIDLLMALPVEPIFEEIDLSKMQKADGTQLTMEETAIGGYITRDTESGNPNRLIVHLVFSKDINTTWDDYFNAMVHAKGAWYQNQVSFVYLHEALHLLMRHFDFYINRSYYDIIDEFRPDFDEDQKSELLNHAFDYWINAYLLENAASGTQIEAFKGHDKIGYLYDPNLSPNNNDMTQQEIVIKLAKEAKIETQELCDAEGNVWGSTTTITINGNSSTSVTINGAHSLEGDTVGDAGSNIQEIDEVLDNTRRDMLEKSRGSGSAGTLTELGVDYSVPLDWFNLLKSSLFTLSHKYTNTYDQTWSKIKNKFRHVATMPGRIHYDKQMAVIISVDQSGSMSDQDLEKVNYVVTELSKKAVFTEILLHDTRVAERKRFIGKKFQGIREFVTKRVAYGGTSHAEVFEIVEEIRKERPDRKLIYLSFSDNYSDIEQVYRADTFAKIPAYWIMTTGGKPIDVPGMQISLEEGLLKN